MAHQFYVRTPDALCIDGRNPSSAWNKWKQKFQIFLQATGASDKPNKVKVGLLLNHIGDEGLEIFGNLVFLPDRPDPEAANTRRLPAESNEDLQTVLRKFDQYFNRRDPQLMLREQFWYHLKRDL